MNAFNIARMPTTNFVSYVSRSFVVAVGSASLDCHCRAWDILTVGTGTVAVTERQINDKGMTGDLYKRVKN